MILKLDIIILSHFGCLDFYIRSFYAKKIDLDTFNLAEEWKISHNSKLPIKIIGQSDKSIKITNQISSYLKPNYQVYILNCTDDTKISYEYMFFDFYLKFHRRIIYLTHLCHSISSNPLSKAIYSLLKKITCTTSLIIYIFSLLLLLCDLDLKYYKSLFVFY